MSGESPIYYSEKYTDKEYEYRHVILPSDMYQKMPKLRLMTEKEWRELGVQQSRGWVHYLLHRPEPNILLFKRPLSKYKITKINGTKITTSNITSNITNISKGENG